MAARALAGLLGKSDALAHLRDHAARLQRLQRAVDTALPQNMRRAVTVANLHDGELVLHVSSSSLASRLKLSAASLLGSLQAGGENLQRLKIRVRPHDGIAEGQKNLVQKRQIGETGRSSLQSLQGSLRQDSPLAQALRKIIDDSA